MTALLLLMSAPDALAVDLPFPRGRSKVHDMLNPPYALSDGSGELFAEDA
jgi:hypothetical protein